MPLVYVITCLLPYGCTLCSAITIAFGLGCLSFVIVLLHAVRHKYDWSWPGLSHLCYRLLRVVWREHYCLWPGLPHLCRPVAVRRLARVFLPLAWVNSSLLSYGRTPYGASIIAFGLGYLMFATIWRYVVWREHYCLWPLIHLCYHMAVRCLARVLLPLA